VNTAWRIGRHRHVRICCPRYSLYIQQRGDSCNSQREINEKRYMHVGRFASCPRFMR